MGDQLSAQDWLDQGLKTLAKSGFYGAEGGAAGQGHGGVARQFLLAFRRYFRVPCRDPERLARDRRRADYCRRRGFHLAHEIRSRSLLRRVFGERLTLENAVRTWASVDPAARAAVQAIDRRRLGYVESLMTQSGLSADSARARAQILE